MREFSKHFVTAVFLLGCASGFIGVSSLQEVLRLPESAFLRDAFCAGLGSSEPAAGGGESKEIMTIDVVGRGTIYRADVAAARKRAVADALQGIVEKAVALVISPAAVAENFQLLSDQVYDQTEAFINDYKVLTESKSGKYYRVMVRATVSMNSIQDRLQSTGVLMMDKGMPTIMLFLSEQNIGESSARYWWGQGSPSRYPSAAENTLSQYMREKGFVIVSRPEVGRDIQLGPEYIGPELSDGALAKLGKQLGADLAIAGGAVARYSGNISDMNMKSIQARVSARAVRTDTGMVLGSSEKTKGVMGADGTASGTEALIAAASAVAQDLARQIVAKWREDPQRAVPVELVVKGIREYADFVRFRKHLKNDIRGIRNVYLRNISAGAAKMDVEVLGNADTLADDLVLQPFEDLSVNINEVSEQVVQVELIPRPAGAGFHE